MFVLGIDPGLTRCGYGAVRSDPSRPGLLEAVAAGVVETDPGLATPKRLGILLAELEELVGELSPDAVCVERVFFQANAQSASGVSAAAGIAQAVASRSGVEVVEYTAQQVKVAVAGNGAAGKADVQRMVTLLLGLRGTVRPPDAADALGLAITHHLAAPVARAVASQGVVA